MDQLALSGGFANNQEPIEKTAARELEEETDISGLDMNASASTALRAVILGAGRYLLLMLLLQITHSCIYNQETMPQMQDGTTPFL